VSSPGEAGRERPRRGGEGERLRRGGEGERPRRGGEGERPRNERYVVCVCVCASEYVFVCAV